ncbi:hypothetical protein A9977_12250 [Variovorax sp. UMC13]|nr:hypothetical protein [Variovorax sp. UMC13]
MPAGTDEDKVLAHRASLKWECVPLARHVPPCAPRPAWEEPLAARRPVLLEVKTDPNVPALPPHINFEQAKKFGRAVIKRGAGGRSMLARIIGQATAG